METTLVQKQLQLRANYDEKLRLERTLYTVQQQITEHEKRKSELEKEFSREQFELHQMDRFSFINVIRKWRGTHGELREKEHEDAAKAELKLNEHDAMLRDLREDEAALELKLQMVHHAEVEWKTFLKEKEQLVKTQNSAIYGELESRLERISEYQSLLNELDEAIFAGRAAERSLGQALKKLNDAHGMSTWDTFLGGGMIVTMMKHDDLDKSESALHEAQLNLQRFEAELTDVQQGVTEGLFVERGSFVTFADYFFDDIFSEWSIHNRINDSITKVEETQSKLARVIGNLQMQRGQVEQGLEKAKQDYEQAVEAC